MSLHWVVLLFTLCLCDSFLSLFFLPNKSNPHTPTLECTDPPWLGLQQKSPQKDGLRHKAAQHVTAHDSQLTCPKILSSPSTLFTGLGLHGNCADPCLHTGFRNLNCWHSKFLTYSAVCSPMLISKTQTLQTHRTLISTRELVVVRQIL